MKMRLAIALIFIAALSRLFPHPDNFTPIGAMGLFAAAHFNRNWMMLAVPFAALFLSDLILNNVIYSQLYDGFTLITSWWIYAAFALVMLVGYVMLRGKVSPARVAVASLMASGAFFLVTNFSVWEGGYMLYPKNFAGLMTCYAAGLPFFGNTVLGDLVFSAILFGSYEWVLRSKFVAERA